MRTFSCWAAWTSRRPSTPLMGIGSCGAARRWGANHGARSLDAGGRCPRLFCLARRGRVDMLLALKDEDSGDESPFLVLCAAARRGNAAWFSLMQTPVGGFTP